LANGTYTVTPNISNGYVYSPAGRTITINNSHVLGLAFASQQTYAISGTINGAGCASPTVTLTGSSTATVIANSSGVYTFSGLSNGSYTVTPAKRDMSFLRGTRL
jgi:hypothetical protein